jgi:hypothetical protein
LKLIVTKPFGGKFGAPPSRLELKSLKINAEEGQVHFPPSPQTQAQECPAFGWAFFMT